MFKDEVDISVVLSADHLFQLDYVRVCQLHQEHYLSIGALCVG
jgi:ADP-glucose pyrophosphorylase